LINATGGLMNNPWGWTRIVNLLILEAPIGVGFSYCSRQLEGKVCKNTDRYTATASRAGLVDFFTTKFPELQKNEFYITGESYAGVYIPTLTKEILDHPSSKGLINLKGVAVGDPCTDNDAQKDSMDPLVSTLKVLCCCVLNVCCVVMVDILMAIFSLFFVSFCSIQ
jgi:cathepsin A (carboxypeptidase C)